MEKKTNLSLNWIQKEFDVLAEKENSGLRVLQGWVEYFPVWKFFLRENQTLM